MVFIFALECCYGVQQFCWNVFERDLGAMLKISRMITALWIMGGGEAKKRADGVY